MDHNDSDFGWRATSKELGEISFALEHAGEDHAELVQKWNDMYSQEEFKRRFECEVGYHEAGHATYMVMEMFESYVLEHPNVVADPQAFRYANIVHHLMNEIYGIVMGKIVDEPTS